ncbi:MAG: sugar phosphate nucleotidyltransferase, partial [Dehalococcoidia bacterium]
DDPEYTEQPEPLGTGHALEAALARVPLTSRHILLLNADLPLVTSETLSQLMELHASRQAVVTLLTVAMPADEADALARGRLQRGARGKPLAVIEAAEAKPSGATTVDVNVGAYALDTNWTRGAVPELPRHPSGEYYVTDLVSMAVADGKRVETLTAGSSDEALGIDSRNDLARAERIVQQRLRAAAMASGVTMLDPDTVYLDATVEFSEDVTVHPNTSIRGLTRISAGASIGPNAQVTDSSIGEGCVVGPAVVESSTLEAGARVGPYSHLRVDSYLEQGVYIGSHVEVKASRLGRGVHVGHFSYIGNAVIGADANIGAGTVTCNYDGVSKHVTEIGEGAFIGSDSLLIAPVKVGAGAITAAGAVVNRDVAPGEKVAGVPARPLHSTRRPVDAATGTEGGRSLG